MKIVQIIPSLEKGGGERFLVELSSALAKNTSDSIYVISLFDNDNDSSFLGDLAKSIHYFSLSKRKGLDPSIFYKLYKLLRNIDPDIIHTHLGALEYVLPYKFLCNKAKIFHTIHNQASAECPSDYVKKIRRRLFKCRRVIPITISKECSISFYNYYALNSDVIIENGRSLPSTSIDSQLISDEYKRNSQNEYLFVNIARISKQKNQKLLIDAINQINREKKYICKLLIIGDIQHSEIFDDIQDRIYDDNIFILKSKKNVADYLIAADAFCLSSSYEGMPISLIEAFAMGCIPICTSVGGIKDMIEDGKTGFLSESLELDAYVRAIKRFIETSDKDLMRMNCRNEFKLRYDIAITVARHKELYTSILK